MFKSDAAQEGVYRFLRNPRVKAESLEEPHWRATLERARAAGVVRVVHDTTTFTFHGEEKREGLGWIDRNTQGFLDHLALVTDLGGGPLGVLAHRSLFRSRPPVQKRSKKEKRHVPLQQRESARWVHVFSRSHERLAGLPAVHVMDREGDSFVLLGTMRSAGARFVVRMHHDRSVALQEEGPRTLVSKMLATVPAELNGTVNVSRRSGRVAGKKAPPKMRRTHPAREARQAYLEVNASPVLLFRSHGVPAAAAPATLSLNVVRVKETRPPAGQKPVEWVLFTTEPITTPEEIAEIVQHYAGRWIVEEYFKALKTGCAYEKRQLETRASFLNALALFIPVAWQLLALRHMAHHAPDEPATHVLTPVQLKILPLLLKANELPSAAPKTAKAALLAIAALGGHIKNNGDPGWIVLGRGMEELIQAEHAIKAFNDPEEGSDQS